jgi:AraC-like DNA-binding protein
LVLRRYFKKRHLSDIFLAAILAITAFQCTTYTIGFMEWYDTFRNTKINYYLVDVTLAIGPSVFFYVLFVTHPARSFKRTDWLHYLPFGIYFAYEVFVWMFDSMQPGYWDQQNGWWLTHIDLKYVSPFQSTLGYLSKVLYFAFSIQLYWNYRQRIQAYFSNTYRMELNWIRNFLLIYCILLFAFQYMMDVINTFITPLHWQQNWWTFLAMAITAYYLGMKGYFTDISKLFALTGKAEVKTSLEPKVDPLEKEDTLEEWKSKLEALMPRDQPYLDPDLTLGDLARKVGVSTNTLSQVINASFGMNFNDFVNSYRVEAIKEKLRAGEQKQKSLLGIAFDCGFNSKATFNRTFKKFTQVSPSEFSRKIASN